MVNPRELTIVDMAGAENTTQIQTQFLLPTRYTKFTDKDKSKPLEYTGPKYNASSTKTVCLSQFNEK